MPIDLTPISPDDVTGYYGSQVDMENVYGDTNIARYSDMTRSDPPTTNFTRIQAASDYADGQINAYFRDGAFSTPLAFIDSSSRVMARNWYAVIAGSWLYESNGIRDEQVGNKYTEMVKKVYAEMALHKSGIRRLGVQRRWPSPTSPVGGTANGN